MKITIRNLQANPRMMLVLAATLGLTATACRSKLDVKSKDGGEMPGVAPPEEPKKDEPVPEPPPPIAEEKAPPTAQEKKDALALKGGKLFFQSRDTITISINKDVIEGSPSFSLLNVTAGEEAPQEILKDQATPEAFALWEDRDGFSLVQSVEDGKLVLVFYPDSEGRKKFSYGKNKLKIVANDVDNPRYAYIELTLQDFDVFGVAVTSFATNIQVAKVEGPDGYQFQGWVNVLSPPTVVADNTVLTHGLFNMVNPH